DGHPNNLSWNCGVEGETDDPQIAALRAQQKRNLLASLFLSIGTPMLLMGDELSRTQKGNNNAYCQDNEISWLDWEAGGGRDPYLLSFVQSIDLVASYFPNKVALHLVLLTLVRSTEALGARWGEFDLEKAEWRIPAERMKMRRQHIVPLPE